MPSQCGELQAVTTSPKVQRYSGIIEDFLYRVGQTLATCTGRKAQSARNCTRGCCSPNKNGEYPNFYQILDDYLEGRR